MAAGKPIVATATDECRHYPSVLIAGSREEFVIRVDEALGLRSSPEYLRQLRADLAGNTWNDKALAIHDALADLFAREAPPA